MCISSFVIETISALNNKGFTVTIKEGDNLSHTISWYKIILYWYAMRKDLQQVRGKIEEFYDAMADFIENPTSTTDKKMGFYKNFYFKIRI